MLAVDHEHSPTERISDRGRPHGPLHGQVYQQIHESRPALRDMRSLLLAACVVSSRRMLSWESVGGKYQLRKPHNFLLQQYIIREVQMAQQLRPSMETGSVVTNMFSPICV